jgi:hypothetical protein
MNTPLKAKSVLELDGRKVNGNGDELRTTACAATACTPTEPAARRAPTWAAGPPGCVGKHSAQQPEGAQGKGGLEGEGLPSVAQRPSRTGEPGTGIPVFASAKMPLHYSALVGQMLPHLKSSCPFLRDRVCYACRRSRIAAFKNC